jgi:hypothetical protein
VKRTIQPIGGVRARELRAAADAALSASASTRRMVVPLCAGADIFFQLWRDGVF